MKINQRSGGQKALIPHPRAPTQFLTTVGIQSYARIWQHHGLMPVW